MDDVFAGKCRFNAAVRPERTRGVRPDDPFDSLRSLRAGPLGRTPQENFDGRRRISDDVREVFLECYRRHETDARLEQGFFDGVLLSIQEQAKVDRIAIVKALLEQDLLLFRRRRSNPAFFRRKHAESSGGQH
jgi:hypothetical protein